MHVESTSSRYTRRRFVGCLSSLAVGNLARAAASTFDGVEVNHVALRVTDLAQMEDFLRRHLGSPGIIFEKPGQRYLRVGRNFTALFEHQTAGLDHFAISVNDYDAESVEQRCSLAGLHVRRSNDLVYIKDPDGIEVQIAHVDHEVNSPVVRKAEPNPTFKGIGVNHIALRVTDIPKSRDFYLEHFGLKVNNEGDDFCFLGLGENFIALFRREEAGLDHYCYSIENYDATKTLQTLQDAGLEASRDVNRVYFEAPNGFTIQLAA